MRRKAENRRNMANNQTDKSRSKVLSFALSSHDFDEFIDEMLSDDKPLDDRAADTPICHVY